MQPDPLTDAERQQLKELKEFVRDFLELAPPSMNRPYAPADYDVWRIMRKDARTLLYMPPLPPFPPPTRVNKGL